MTRPNGGGLSSLCTIITTTSPTPSNPSTELIAETMRCMRVEAPELLECRNILVCDGYKIGAVSKFRCGIVTEERAEAYETYIASVKKHAEAKVFPEWEHVEVLTLEERQGFGFAVKAALEHVTTPWVFILQHDRTFMRPFHRVEALLRTMEADPRLRMVGLPTTTNDPTNYLETMATKLGRNKVVHPRLESTVVQSESLSGIRFLPLIQWHDSSHFASTEYYRNFVFGTEEKLVAKGGFIEDKLGQQQGFDLREKGWSSHAKYGTWLLDDGVYAPARMVGHLDGKRFLRKEEKAALEAQERAAKAEGIAPSKTLHSKTKEVMQAPEVLTRGAGAAMTPSGALLLDELATMLIQFSVGDRTQRNGQ